jgi:hypothetical protein
MIRTGILASRLYAWNIIVLLDQLVYEFSQGGRNEILDYANPFLGTRLDIGRHVHLFVHRRDERDGE